MGRLRILSVDPIQDERRCTMVLMVLEGVLQVGASIQYRSRHLAILAIAKPNYRRRQVDKLTSEDLLDAAKEGETVEALVDTASFDLSFADLLYHDFWFR